MEIEIKELTEQIKNALENLLFTNNKIESFTDSRIIVTITKEEIKIKVVKILLPRKKSFRLPPETQRKIQEAKKILKDRSDVLYLFTLLMSLHSELNKINVGELDEQCKTIILPVVCAVEKDMVKLLEVKRL